MQSHQEFGATIGQALVEASANEDVPKVAAAQFVSGVFNVHSGAKLPSLLSNNAVREWMERVGVSESTLRAALTEERRRRREDARNEATVRVPPRPRAKRVSTSGSSNTTKRNSPAIKPQIGGVVPNQSLDLL